MSLNRRHHSESGVRYQAINTTGGGVNSLIADQLNLELKLQENCRKLLNSYKESQNWPAVGQLAQTLVTNSARVNDLKRRLAELENSNKEGLLYLERIPESRAQVVGGKETFKDGLEGLCKPTSDLACINKQSSSSAAQFPAGDLKADQQPAATDPVQQNSDLRTAAITPPHLSTPDSVGGVDTVFREEEILELESQMEDLADQFADLSEQYQAEDSVSSLQPSESFPTEALPTNVPQSGEPVDVLKSSTASQSDAPESSESVPTGAVTPTVESTLADTMAQESTPTVESTDTMVQESTPTVESTDTVAQESTPTVESTKTVAQESTPTVESALADTIAQESTPTGLAIDTTSGGTELGVPKAADALSEGSDQFFSPSESLYNEEEETSGEERDEQFEDARSGGKFALCVQ